MTTQSKKILIIGATGGIGSAIVQTISKLDNTQLILVDRNEDNLASLIKNIPSTINPDNSHIVNLENTDEVATLCEKIIKEHEKIDWIVNTAGFISKEEQNFSSSEDMIKSTFNINTLSVIQITQALAPILNEGGGIINISSTAGIWGNDQYPVYSASKGALNTFTQATARFFTSKKLTAIALCPGPTNTPMRESIANDAQNHQSPNIIAETVTDILSNQKYKNGDILITRGGVTKIHSNITN